MKSVNLSKDWRLLLTSKYNNELKGYKESVLDDLIPRFSKRGVDLNLERIEKALNEIGKPSFSIPAIQIAGTNGKGSIANFIQNTLKAAKIKAGVTTSPHLISWCERICVDGKLISTDELVSLITSLKSVTSKHNLTPFELLITAAFQHFEINKVKLIVLEVGLGGRLDATTAHPYRPIIAMSSIGLDHCECLGKTLKEIALEKAAIITPGSSVISAYQHPDVAKVFEHKAKEKNAIIKWVSPISKSWKLGLSGNIQRQNAAVAKASLESLSSLGWRISQRNIKEGFALAKWPGRLQMATWQTLPLLIDAAHNPPAAEQLAREREHWSGNKSGVQWILGIQANKEGPNIIRSLLKPFDNAWIIPVPEHRSWTGMQLSINCPEMSSQIRQANNVKEVLETISSTSSWPTPVPVISGSIYLLGHLIANQIISTD